MSLGVARSSSSCGFLNLNWRSRVCTRMYSWLRENQGIDCLGTVYEAQQNVSTAPMQRKRRAEDARLLHCSTILSTRLGWKMSGPALSTTPTPDAADPPPKKRSFWRPSLCRRCRLIQLETWLLPSPTLRTHTLPHLYTCNINDCDYCQLFFHTLTTDQKDERTGYELRIRTRYYFLKTDFFARRLLTIEPYDCGALMALHAVNPRVVCSDAVIYPSKHVLPPMLALPFISMTVVQTWLESSGVTQEKGTVTDTILSEFSHDMSGLTVIDCRSKSLMLVPLPTEERYMTLSYVWGPTQTEEEPIKDSKLPPKLPQTIADAIMVCSSLGFRFLWIDRYCIPQTDEQVKSELIARMDKIYNCSSLTLIACVGNGPQHGLTGISRPRVITPRIRGYQIVPMTQDVKTSVWASRGWTFQEAFLSRRQLYFTDRQLIFQGVDSIETELTAGSNVKFDPSLDPIFPCGSFLTEFPQRRILECIAEYSGRTLARPETDRLLALYGIFSAFENTSIRHLWGLPFTHDSQDLGLSLGTSLCWNRKLRPRRLRARHVEFPTWSWASCPDQVSYDLVLKVCLVKTLIELEGVELLTGKIISFEEYRSCCDSMGYNPQHLSKFIHIVAHHTTLLSIRDSRHQFYRTVDVPLSNGKTSSHKIYLYPDPLELPLTRTDVLVAVHLYLHPAQKGVLLFLRERGEYWERIGMCSKFEEKFWRWKTEPRKFRLG
jgi:hypothetical protein